MTAAGPGRGFRGLAPPMHGGLPEPATPACPAWKGGPGLGAEAGVRKWIPGVRALVTPPFPASSAPWRQLTTRGRCPLPHPVQCASRPRPPGLRWTGLCPQTAPGLPPLTLGARPVLASSRVPDNPAVFPPEGALQPGNDGPVELAVLKEGRWGDRRRRAVTPAGPSLVVLPGGLRGGHLRVWKGLRHNNPPGGETEAEMAARSGGKSI